jgi:hypothetical protein
VAWRVTVQPIDSMQFPMSLDDEPSGESSFFMNKFRKLCFVEYNGEIPVHSSLLNIVPHD